MSSRELVLAALATIAASCGDVSSPRSVECGTQPVEVLPNRGFDDPTPPWVQEPVSPALLCGQPRITPKDGTQAGCLGGVDGTTQTLTQTVPLPEGASNLTLSGQICIATEETAALEHDVVQFDLLDSGNVIAAFGKKTNQQGVAKCDYVAFELTATTPSDPETATLRIRSTLDANLPTSFYVDSLSLKVGCTK
jgi:hypothetical protein